MRGELKTLQHRLGVTTIYVTHDQIEAMTLGDRMAVLKDGKLQQVGNPLDVYNNPYNIFVAGFLGTPPMNLLPAEIIKRNNKNFIILGDTEIDLPDEKIFLINSLKKKNFILGIRPEDIEIIQKKLNKGFTKEIILIERLGNEVLLHIKIGKEEVLVKQPQDKAFTDGETRRFYINLDKVHIFNEKGKNIAAKMS